MTPALECRGLGVRIRGHRRLQDQDFQVAPGEFVALLGANGAGKTTLLRLIMGLLAPTEGTIELGGRACRPGAARIDVGYVPQSVDAETRVPLRLRDVVGFGCPVVGRGGWRLSREGRARVAEAMAAMDIDGLADRPVQSLSGGESRRMHLARVLCQQARLLLLDEPASHLDLRARCDFFERLDRLHREHGMAIVLVMHDVNAVPPGCERARVLDAGKTVYDGPFVALRDPAVRARHCGGPAFTSGGQVSC